MLARPAKAPPQQNVSEHCRGSRRDMPHSANSIASSATDAGRPSIHFTSGLDQFTLGLHSAVCLRCTPSKPPRPIRFSTRSKESGLSAAGCGFPARQHGQHVHEASICTPLSAGAAVCELLVCSSMCKEKRGGRQWRRPCVRARPLPRCVLSFARGPSLDKLTLCECSLLPALVVRPTHFRRTHFYQHGTQAQSSSRLSRVWIGWAESREAQALWNVPLLPIPPERACRSL